MSGKNLDEKSFDFLTFSEAPVFEVLTILLSMVLQIKTKGLDLVKRDFLEKFAKKDDTKNVIPEATDAMFHSKDLLSSLDSLYHKYLRIEFKGEAYFGFIRVGVVKILSAATFATYRGMSSYDELPKIVKGLDRGTRSQCLLDCTETELRET